MFGALRSMFSLVPAGSRRRVSPSLQGRVVCESAVFHHGTVWSGNMLPRVRKKPQSHKPTLRYKHFQDLSDEPLRRFCWPCFKVSKAG
jgi:hypothetical protein